MSKLNVFSRLPQFTGSETDAGLDLHTWLKTFERCCTIAEKNDDLVKGQLLMLSVGGRALAILEQLEEEKATQLKYGDLKAKLQSTFDSPADREALMTKFEQRIQGVEETHDEYMLELIKLYKAANPETEVKDMNRAVKRKFLNGVQDELRRNIFIFCNNPLDDEITHQDLLKASRNAQIHLPKQPQISQEFVDFEPMDGSSNRINITKPTLKPCDPTTSTVAAITSAAVADKTLDAIMKLNKKLDEQALLTEQRFKQQEDKIHLLSKSQNYQRNKNNYQDNFSASLPSNSYEFNRSQNRSTEIRCFYCQELNHVKRDCVMFKRHTQQQSQTSRDSVMAPQGNQLGHQ